MRRFYLPLVVLSIAAIVLSGCGGGGGGGNGSDVSVSVQGPQSPIGINASTTITADVTGAANTAVTWSIVEGSPAGGTLSNVQANSVTYTAPNVPGTYRVRATSQEDPSKSATATITVSAGVVNVTVSGPTSPLFPGDTADITATVTGTTNTAVTWSIVEGSPAGGTLSNVQPNSVTYTAPNVDSGTFHVRATSQADPTKSAAITIIVSDLPPPPPAGSTSTK